MENIIPRFFEFPKQSFFIFGPRGTGKSTWLRAKIENALWVDLLEADIYRSYNARPERLRELIEANPDKSTVVIDEIQKVPELLSQVHSLIEKKKGLRFILTGSSVRKLKRAGIDLLAGRVLKKTFHPFMASELGKDFDINKALKYGLIPLITTASNPEDVLKSYAALYVREEVQMEGLVRNIGNFSRFLEAISLSHGSILNITSVARECEVERKAVEGYISILEDLLLSYRIPVFTKRAKRAVTAHPKFYFFDTGIFRSLRPSGPLDRTQDIEGCSLEGLILQHLVAWNAYGGEKNRIYYWRTRSGVEVDFIVYGQDMLWAVEVKNTQRIRPEDLTSLRGFKEEYPESVAFYLYRGKERLLVKDILCIPCEEFLKEFNQKFLPVAVI